MGWTITDDVEAYAAAVGPLLGADPERHTIALTVVENARAGNPPVAEWYAWWTGPDGAVGGAVSRTMPYPLLLEVAPEESLRPLLDAALKDGREVSGVNGPAGLSTQFAALVTAASGRRAVLRFATRLFRLAELVEPAPAPAGSARRATLDDLPLLVRWNREFAQEIGEPMGADLDATVRARAERGLYWLWLDPDRRPVSLAGLTLPAAGVVRVGPVYTPPTERGHGYAAGVTHAASRALLDDGHRVVLFADLANPTSNALYQRLGYRPVTDRATFHFE
jgi:predicted GNAT family acetyltransferase